ncbi:MAG: ATPase, T2SS/T4P/T4SS family [Hallerella porci]|uniref:ATPase, T2SS/T4P/T4SS family n=1 Tax=Hallerella porci TaxID=1945871 RepID=UPI002A833224|nr:ATPase, T2SS/T4P/T4SS family [Hallerella porci]MDY3922377.1 ATPase, T2SS/T4P/T4SS family [Hallerella porci]
MMTKNQVNQIIAKVLLKNNRVSEKQVQEYWTRVDNEHDIGRLLLDAGIIDQKTYQVVLQYVNSLEAKLQAKEFAEKVQAPAPTPAPQPAPAANPEPALAIEGNNPYGQPTATNVQIEKVEGLEQTSIASVSIASEPAPEEKETAEKKEDALPDRFEIESGEGSITPPEQLTTENSLAEILAFARKYGATDVYLSKTSPIAMRICGMLGYVNDKPYEASQLSRLLAEAKAGFADGYEPVVGQDFSKSIAIPGTGRNRLIVSWNETVPNLAFRVISSDAIPLQSLYLPAFCHDFVKLQHGLVLIAGPSGSGRSTTLSAFGEAIASERSVLMQSIEKTIERILSNAKGITIQKEVGLHTSSGVLAVREAVNSSAQVILFDHLDTTDELRALLQAASSGALVFVVTIGKDIFGLLSRLLSSAGDGASDLAASLADELRGVIVQHLIPVIDNQGWVLAVEALKVTSSISDLIRKQELSELPAAIAALKSQGVSLDDSLQNLVESGYIRGEDAWLRSQNRRRFAAYRPQTKG